MLLRRRSIEISYNVQQEVGIIIVVYSIADVINKILRYSEGIKHLIFIYRLDYEFLIFI